MSITDDIRACVAKHQGKSLFQLPSLLPRDYPTREVVVSEEVFSFATEPWSENHREALRETGFRGVLDAFTVGEEFSIARKPFDKPGYAMLAPLHPVSDDVWDVRSTDPRPGIRGLGAFGGKNFLIVLAWDYRENFEENSDHWAAEIDRCKAEWHKLFGSIPRFRGASLDEYISDYYPV